jgi:hypothetical protein
MHRVLRDSYEKNNGSSLTVDVTGINTTTLQGEAATWSRVEPAFDVKST